VQRFGCKNAIHAEANAIAFAARNGVPTVNATLFVTLSPCKECSKLLIAAGIFNVIFRDAYRDESGIELLRSAGVGVEQI